MRKLTPEQLAELERLHIEPVEVPDSPVDPETGECRICRKPAQPSCTAGLSET